jgi:hypothetical protein
MGPAAPGAWRGGHLFSGKQAGPAQQPVSPILTVKAVCQLATGHGGEGRRRARARRSADQARARPSPRRRRRVTSWPENMAGREARGEWATVGPPRMTFGHGNVCAHDSGPVEVGGYVWRADGRGRGRCEAGAGTARRECARGGGDVPWAGQRPAGRASEWVSE